MLDRGLHRAKQKYNTDSKGLSAKEKKRLLLSLEESKFIKKDELK